MIKINIKTYNLIKVKSFTNFDDLEIYCRKLCLLVSDHYHTFINEADALANKIWNTNVGQSIKTDLGHIVTISGKSPYHNTEHGKQMYGS
jgi:hypothetical protein